MPLALRRYPLLHMVPALLAFCSVGAARADDPDAMVKVTCDPSNGELRIEERFEEAPYDAPYPRLIRVDDVEFSTRGLAWAKEVNGQVTWNARKIRRTCRLGADTYVAIFSAYKPSWNVQGQCGGGTSTVSLTVTLNNEIRVKNLVLHVNCNSEQEIESVRLLARTQEIVATISTRGKQELRYARVSLSASLSRDTLFSVATHATAP